MTVNIERATLKRYENTYTISQVIFVEMHKVQAGLGVALGIKCLGRKKPVCFQKLRKSLPSRQLRGQS